MKYNLELDKIANKIKDEKAKLVCLQLPDGLRTQATSISKELEQKSDAKIVLWLGSCWGACDTPVGLNDLKFDMIIQFGHSAWPFY